ncbi:MAG: 2-C-methyl-D-erythritol 4-phosphate cytidylyltransferase [Chloroflexi bacterium]|nr:2-C-methyl-D-erythritol 4-phosphate cytidylyltransferase [Chloroflexota bacterium]
MIQKEKVGAVIAAAGESRRMEGIDKLFAPMGGQPLLARVIDVFERCEQVDQIVVVLSEANLEQGKQMVAERKWTKVTDVCSGGERRQDSVKNGLARLKGCHWVIIHDGARPLVTGDLVKRGLEAAAETDVAIAAVPVTDTIKLVGKDNFVVKTLERQSLWAVQTPQVFRFAIISEAYHHARNDVTDDATLVEQMGSRVKVYMSSYDNIKVTTPADLALANVLLKKHEG